MRRTALLVALASFIVLPAAARAQAPVEIDKLVAERPLGERTFELKAGSAVLIPRGVVHAYRAEGPEPTVAIAVFAPAFDGKDRHEPPAPRPQR